MTEIDVSRVPKGIIAAQTLIAAVAQQGDLAERHYLEVKSTLDLSTKRAKEKIAKFILGSANRMPDVAAAAFEGYGVMIIGVDKGAVMGVLPVEMMDLAKVVQPYIGAAGPRWDILWVPVEGSTKRVLLVLVEPPALGHGPFPCRANGESLTDGRIYIRAEGETREANSEEFDLLVQRGEAEVAPDINFAIEVIGDVATVRFDDAKTIEEYLRLQRSCLIGALPKNEAVPPAEPESLKGPYAHMTGIASAFNAVSVLAAGMMEPETRTEQEYLESIDEWEDRFRTAWKLAQPKITASQLVPAVVKVANRATTFFHDVEVKLHLEGEIEAYEYYNPEWVEDFYDLKLPRPPRKWGPRERTHSIPSYANMVSYSGSGARQYIPPSISFENGGSVTLNLDVGELRPLDTYKSEEAEIVLIVADPSLTSIRGTWELTARDHNNVYTGEIVVPVSGDRDITSFSRTILGLKDSRGLDDSEG